MLNAARIKAAIIGKMQTKIGQPPSGDWEAIAEAIAEAVVEEFGNAVVNPGTMNVAAAAVEGTGTVS